MKIFAALSVVAASWLSAAWLLMLTVGIVHAEWIPQLPTIGFRLALLLASIVLLRALIAGLLSGVTKGITGKD